MEGGGGQGDERWTVGRSGETDSLEKDDSGKLERMVMFSTEREREGRRNGEIRGERNRESARREREREIESARREREGEIESARRERKRKKGERH